MSSRTLKKKFISVLAPHLLKWMLVPIAVTCRKKWLGKEFLEELQKTNDNWIYALWHNNITLASFILKNQNLLSMVSSSGDGRIAARVIELFGNQTIRGSSSRGGTKVLLSMISGIKSGKVGAITPDGPRGPKYHLHSGALSISQKTKVPLVPFHVESTRQWIFSKSWDQHKFPKPFSTIVISIGKPFQVPEKLDKEQFAIITAEFKNRMMQNVKLAQDTVNNLD